MAEVGNNLVVEHVTEDEPCMQRLVELMRLVDVFFVGVRCDLPELERQERTRNDRLIKDARRDFETVNDHANRDVEVDTMATPPHAHAEQIIAELVGDSER